MNLKMLQNKKSIGESNDKSEENKSPKIEIIKSIITQSNALLMKNNKIIENMDLSKVLNSSLSTNRPQFIPVRDKNVEKSGEIKDLNSSSFLGFKGNLTPDSITNIKLPVDNNNNNENNNQNKNKNDNNKSTKYSILSNFRQIRKSIEKIPDKITAVKSINLNNNNIDKNINNLKTENGKNKINNNNNKNNKDIMIGNRDENSTKNLFRDLSEIKISQAAKAKNFKIGFGFEEENERSFYKNNNISININNNINNNFEILNISKSAISDVSGKHSAIDSCFHNNNNNNNNNSKLNITNTDNKFNEASKTDKNSKSIRTRASLTKRNSVGRINDNEENGRSGFCVGNFFVDLKKKTIISGYNAGNDYLNRSDIDSRLRKDENDVSRNLSFTRVIDEDASFKNDDSFMNHVDKSFNASLPKNVEINDAHKILVLTNKNNCDTANISIIDSAKNISQPRQQKEFSAKRQSLDSNKNITESKKENTNARISLSKSPIRTSRNQTDQVLSVNKSVIGKETKEAEELEPQKATNKDNKNTYQASKYSILGDLREKSSKDMKKQTKEIIKSNPNPIPIENMDENKSSAQDKHKNKRVVFKDTLEEEEEEEEEKKKIINVGNETVKPTTIQENKEREKGFDKQAHEETSEPTDKKTYISLKNNTSKRKDKNITLDKCINNLQRKKSDEIFKDDIREEEEICTEKNDSTGTQNTGKQTIIDLNLGKNEIDLKSRIIEFNKSKANSGENDHTDKSAKKAFIGESASSYVPITKRNSINKSQGSNSSSSNSHNKSIPNAHKRISVTKFLENAEAANNSNISFGENEPKYNNKETTKEKSAEPRLILEESKNGSLIDKKFKEKPKVKFQNFEDEDSKLDFAVIKSNDGKVPNNNINQFDNGNRLNKVTKEIKKIFEISRCGYQGANIEKTNQDNFVVAKNILNEKDSYFFAVFDGHGVNGHEVSGFLKHKLIDNLKNLFNANKISSNDSNLDLWIKETYVKTNEDLSNEIDSNIMFSGSTCISVLFTPSKIICANIGDSRAVMGRQSQGDWICYELSIDHKPTDKNEAIRIENSGGRVEPFKDEKGNEIGPYRVWLKDEPIPGLAMTRSFGDQIAATVGVTAEPEIFEIEFTADDKFIILASDGLWEFMESEEVVEVVSGFHYKKDYRGALDFLVKESSMRWMEKEKIIDDITIILIFLE